MQTLKPQPTQVSKSTRPEPLAVVKAVSKPKRRRRKGKVLLLIRRIHLYSGLVLLPWVILYGFSAMLFNHPSWMSSREVTTIGATPFDGTAFENIGDAEPMAQQVMAAALAQLNEPGQEEVGQQPPAPPRIERISSARFLGSFFFFVRHDGERDSFIVDPSGTAAKLYSTPVSLEEEQALEQIVELENPFDDVDAIELDQVDSKDLQAAVPGVLAAAGETEGDVLVRSMPTLHFNFEADGQPWKGEYQLRGGKFTAEPDTDDFGTKESRSLMTRLHVAHGYSATRDARWVWAAVVDVMGIAMLFWGFSGIIMWWQIRRTRLIGYAVIGFAGLVAVRLTISMLAGYDL